MDGAAGPCPAEVGEDFLLIESIRDFPFGFPVEKCAVLVRVTE